jgi:murein L,D-transpeptidase YcbB/YkuD
MRRSTIECFAGIALAIVVIQPGLAAPASVDGSAHPLPTPRPAAQVVVPIPQPRQDEAQRQKPAPGPVVESKAVDLKSTPNKAPAGIDGQISEKLRGLAAAHQFDSLMPHQSERSAAEAFYKARDYAPIWIKDGTLTLRARAAIRRIKNAAADGLNPADYAVPEFGSFAGAEALAEGDVTLTNSVLDYARHLETGRIAPTRVAAEVDYGNHAPDPAAILREVTSASDLDATLESYNPPNAGFRALKNQLAMLRANTHTDAMPAGHIANGPVLRLGIKDPRVPMLRAKLKTRAPKKTADTTYDRDLAKAVYYLQKRAGLRADGNLNNRTLAVINGPAPMPAARKIDIIVANMERWRWLPRDLGKKYVMVNIPDYTLKVVKDGDVVWRTKIVSGKPQTPTPLLTAAMDNVIVNPSWYVPQSIIQNELLPKYETDPHIFERMGLEVRRGSDGAINVVQPPGAANALGHIKFNFPNKFQVYLHDTPQKRLFQYDQRAFSHGCMRVENPSKFGEVVLAMAMSGATPDARALSGMYGEDERHFKLTSRPMVHLTYQTAYVDDGGKLVIRDDIYGFDQRIHTILTTNERKIADVAPPRDPKRDLATFRSNQQILRRVQRREAANPLAFFEHVFR